MIVNLSPTRRLPFAVIAATTLVATSGVAYASGLPAAASDNASAVLQRLGINPGHSDHSTTKPNHPANHGGTVSNLARTTDETGRDKGKAVSAIASTNGNDHQATKAATSGSDSHGSQISTLATTTTAKGVDKGATISTAASGGKSKAGQHGKSGDQHGKAGDQHGNPTQPDPPANSDKGGNGGGPK